jgi:hypothetical protein
VAGTYAGSIVTVEVFIEQQMILPMGVVLEDLLTSKDRPEALCITREDGRQPVRELLGDLIEIHHLATACREFNFEVISVIYEIDEQGTNNHVVDGHPDRAAPVAVAAT